MNAQFLSQPRLISLSVIIVLAALGVSTATASPSNQCSMRLIVELTPDIPNPRDAGFLSSLLSNHVDYALRWVKWASPYDIVLDLVGPGSDDQCRNVIQTMRHDGRILSIQGATS